MNYEFWALTNDIFEQKMVNDIWGGEPTDIIDEIETVSHKTHETSKWFYERKKKRFKKSSVSEIEAFNEIEYIGKMFLLKTSIIH